MTAHETTDPASPDPTTGVRSGRLSNAWRRLNGWVFLAIVVGWVLMARFTPVQPLRDIFGGFEKLTELTLRFARYVFETFGYLAVFLGPLMENTFFLGLLVPGTLVLLLAGLGAHDGLISLPLAIPLAMAGAVIGDTISYAIGRFGWYRLLQNRGLGRWGDRMREPLIERGAWFVVLYHFAGYTRLIGPAAAGFIRMPLRRWALLDYAGVTLWVVVYMMGGYLLGVFGLSLENTEENVRVFEWLILAFVVIWVLFMIRGQRREGGATAAPAADEAAPGEPPLDREEAATPKAP